MKTSGPTFHKDKISALDFQGLLTGAVQYVPFHRAKLRAEGFGEDRRFVMEGPSGKHSLLACATDLARLNAHWQTFANHAANAPAA